MTPTPKDTATAVPADFRLPWNTTRTMADVWVFKPDATASLWTAEATAALDEMWAAGWTCTAIAKALGSSFTKNSVAGKIRRMGLEPRRKIRPHGVWNAETLRYAGREE